MSGKRPPPLAKGAGGISSFPLVLRGDKIPLTPFFKGEFATSTRQISLAMELAHLLYAPKSIGIATLVHKLDKSVPSRVS